ncbi:MAG: CRISPR-associated protein Csx19 [Syntrophobacteraceae bacterium]|jgi:hypothetical protein
MACLHARDLDVEGFLEIVESTSWPADSILMGFSPAEARFEFFRPKECRSFLCSSDQGRIFSPKGELKWRRVDDKLRVVYLGSPPAPGELSDYSDELKPLRPTDSELMLWGERTDLQDEWIEQQVPHRFAYPIGTKTIPRGRAVLTVETWLNKAKIPQFSRYLGLKEVKGEADATR